MAAFDPDAYLAKTAPAQPAPVVSGGFDPDAWLRSKAPQGLRAVQPGDIPTASGFYAEPTPDVPRSFMQRMAGTLAAPLDVALTLGSATGRGLAAPIYGLASGRGEVGAREVLAGIRQPQTPEAAAALEAVSPALAALPPVIGAGVPMLPGTAAQTRAAAGRGVQAVKEATIQPMLDQRAVEKSMASWERAPQIEAATEAQRLGIALNPVDIQPTMGPRLTSLAAGAKGAEKIVEVNRPAVNRVARSDMGMPMSAVLNSKRTFDDARAAVAEPYNKIRQIPTIQADDQSLSALEALRQSESLIGGDVARKKVDRLVDSAVKQMSGGMSGQAFLDNISKLRKDAKRIYDSKSAGPAELDIADTNMAIAGILEQGAERSVFDPKLLAEYRNARERMARIYAYEAATDFNTGNVDVSKIARVTSKGGVYTGDIASLGRIAGNFPAAFNIDPSAPWYQSRVARAGAGATTGTALLSPFGVPGMAIGAMAGTVAGALGSRYAANKLASPAYQAGLRVQDYRLPVNQLATEAPLPPTNALTPYVAPQSVLIPGEGAFVTGAAPNLRRTNEGVFVAPPAPPGPQRQPQAQFVGPAPTPPGLPAPSAEATMATLRAEDARRAAMSRTLGREAEAQQSAAEAAARRPAAGEVILDFDPVTGRFREASQGLKGATPETFRNFGADLASAADKVTAGRRFDLTASEKVAWERTKVDLAEVASGMKALSDEAIAGKMADRQWVQQTIKTAQEKEQGLARREALLAEQLANRNNLRLLARDIEVKNKELAKIKEDRARMAAALESLEDRLRAPRPVELGGQGPKTRAAQRNQLRPASNENKLIVD